MPDDDAPKQYPGFGKFTHLRVDNEMSGGTEGDRDGVERLALVCNAT